MHNSLKLGLCCLRADPKAPKMRTMTLTSFQKTNDLEKLFEIFLHNLSTTRSHIRFCYENQIAHYRISSSIFPIASFYGGFDFLKKFSKYQEIANRLLEIGLTAKDRNISLSIHPDQFVSLGSEKNDVCERSIGEFNFQAEFVEIISDGLGKPIPMCLHVSNGSKDPFVTKNIFYNSFTKLSAYAQSNICLENEDKGCWTPDMLVAHFPDFKLVFDNWHFHLNPGLFTSKYAVESFKRRWATYCGPTTFHWSEGVTTDSRSHADYFSNIPQIVLDNPDVVFECEVKAKELAIMQALRGELLY